MGGGGWGEGDDGSFTQVLEEGLGEISIHLCIVLDYMLEGV